MTEKAKAYDKVLKAYTDIEQSKKLAEILPTKSADMFCSDILVDGKHKYNFHYLETYSFKTFEDTKSRESKRLSFHPCWSLAALLDVIPDSIYDNTDEFSQLEFSKRSIAYHDLNDRIKIGSFKDNLIDACVEMIVKLHDQKLL